MNMFVRVLPYMACAVLVGVSVWSARQSWESATELRTLQLLHLPIILAILALASVIAYYNIGVRIEDINAGRTTRAWFLQQDAEKFLTASRPLVSEEPRPSLWVGYQPADNDEAKKLATATAELLRRAGWTTNDPVGVATEGNFTGIRLITYAGPQNEDLSDLFAARQKNLISVLQLIPEPLQIFPNSSRDDRMLGNFVVGPRSERYPFKGPPKDFDPEKIRFGDTTNAAN